MNEKTADTSPGRWAREVCARDGVLAQGSKHVLMVLASYDRWQVQVSLDRLVLLTGRDRNYVVQSLHALRKRHLVKRKNTPRKESTADVYELWPEENR